ncbi:MAG: S-layer homology domain-containing protein [Oscillospiraceae bacterium]|nr:S-layer homology domain-containing protein [Oscillospiraceae bacterium]
MLRLRYRAAALLTAAVLCCASYGAAAVYSDMAGRPEARVVSRWSDYGVLTGSQDRFDPDGRLTRAHLAVLLQRLLRHPTQAENTYSDLRGDEWYARDVLCVSDLGVMQGSDGRFYPDQVMTREMAVSALARAFYISENSDVSMFSDRTEISLWAARDVGAMASAGYLKPYADGTFRPKAAMTRVEFVMLIDAMFGGYFNTAGSYPTREIASNALVNTRNTTFFYAKVAQNFYVTPGVGDSILYLYNCTVNGTVYLSGGGDVRVMDPSELTIPDITTSTYTSMVVGVAINRIVVNAPWDMTLFTSPIARVYETVYDGPGRSYTYGGKTELLRVQGADTSLFLRNALIMDLRVEAPGASIRGMSATVQNMTVSHPTRFDGFINVFRATVEPGGSGAEFRQKPVLLTLRPGVSVTVDGREYSNNGTEDMIVR